MKKIVIIGASGYGKEVAWVVARLNAVRPAYEIVGFCDDDEQKRGSRCAGFPVLGPIEAVAARWPGIGFHCAVGDNRARKSLFERARAAGWKAVTLVDPAALIAPDSVLGAGCYVGIGSVISAGACLGAGVIVNHQVTVGHDAVLGDFAQLCPGARVSGACAVGEGALLGSNACTIPLVKVGAWATVGAGAALLRDLPEGASVLRINR